VDACTRIRVYAAASLSVARGEGCQVAHESSECCARAAADGL
jgi:hypothetical protein